MASSQLEPEIPFGFRGKEAATIAAGYAKIAFVVFAWGYLIFLLIFLLILMPVPTRTQRT